MRNDERIAEEMRILKAAWDRSLTVNEANRWVIDGQPRPCPKARQYLERNDLTNYGRITDKGRLTLLAHGEMR